jgi:hypothetical protein
MMMPIAQFSPYTSLFGFVFGLPFLIAAYYQSWRARQEAKLAREGMVDSRHCLEFVTYDGTCVNLVPLETLHSLPKPGDVVLLPGDGVGVAGGIDAGAYRIDSVEHIYATPGWKTKRRREARLTKAVAQVTALAPGMIAA